MKSKLRHCKITFLACTLVLPSSLLAITDGSALPPVEDVKASVVGLSNKGKLCTATRIQWNVYLTAGHCVSDLDLKEGEQVEMLRADTKEKVSDYKVVQALTHPKYVHPNTISAQFTMDHFLESTVDLALVWLEIQGTPADIWEIYHTMNVDYFLSTPSFSGVSNNESLKVLGVGCEKMSISDTGFSCSGTNSYAQNNIKMADRTVNDPSLIGGLLTPNGKNYFKTDSDNKRTLGPGDSGGPVFNNGGQLVGIHSLITKNAISEMMNFHVRLSASGVGKWITDSLLADPLLAGKKASLTEVVEGEVFDLARLHFSKDGNFWVKNGDCVCEGLYQRKSAPTAGALGLEFDFSAVACAKPECSYLEGDDSLLESIFNYHWKDSGIELRVGDQKMQISGG